MTEAKLPLHMARYSASPDELLTMRQVAEYTGKSYWYIRALNSGFEKTRKPFPQPFTHIGRSPVWRRQTIDAWKN